MKQTMTGWTSSDICGEEIKGRIGFMKFLNKRFGYNGTSYTSVTIYYNHKGENNER